MTDEVTRERVDQELARAGSWQRLIGLQEEKIQVVETLRLYIEQLETEIATLRAQIQRLESFSDAVTSLDVAGNHPPGRVRRLTAEEMRRMEPPFPPEKT